MVEPAGAPTCPKWLSKEAKAAWRQLVPKLEAMGVLTKIDSNALERYCHLWVRWRQAEEFIREKGEVYSIKDEHGNIKCLMPFPQVAIANKLAQQLTRLEQEFGMTPSARTRIQVSVPMPVSDKSRFFTEGVATRNRAAEGRRA